MEILEIYFQSVQLRRGALRGAGRLLRRPEPGVDPPQVGRILRQLIQVPEVEPQREWQSEFKLWGINQLLVE